MFVVRGMLWGAISLVAPSYVVQRVAELVQAMCAVHAVSDRFLRRRRERQLVQSCVLQSMRGKVCGAIYVGQSTCAQQGIGYPTARANVAPPARPPFGLHAPCGGDCDECLALA
eukprot:3728600-Pyramimonas_sp.AAC.1